ncbi:hypothetical protein QCA50_005408 [Cerrena zonata]|uniref:Uncharacterized protein n=1 Tax=Cerrena zonata TaxID=2478898 RepID=A0AAW0GEW1_9APHY
MGSACCGLATSTFTSSRDEKSCFQAKFTTFSKSERVFTLSEESVGSYEELPIELVCLVQCDLSNWLDVDLLELSASKLLHLPESPIKR